MHVDTVCHASHYILGAFAYLGLYAPGRFLHVAIAFFTLLSGTVAVTFGYCEEGVKNDTYPAKE